MQLNHLADWAQELRPHANAFGAAFGALVGSGIFFGLWFDPFWGWGLVSVGLGLIVWALAWRHVVRALGLGLVVAGITFMLAAWQVARVETVDYVAGEKPHWLVGTVKEIFQKDAPGRVVLRMEDVEAYGLGKGKIERASIGVYRSQVEGVAVGDSVAVQAVLLPPEGPKFKGQRDARLWRFFNDGRVAGYVMGSVEPTWREVRVHSRFDAFLTWIDGLRETIFTRTKGLADGAVAALLVGDERGIGAGIREAYRDTGLSHLLAISGMQLTLVAMGVFWLVRWLGACVPWIALRVDVRLWAALMGLAATFFYTLLAGAGVSVVRASLMAAIVMLAVVSGRLRSAMRGWCAAVVIVLVVSPVMVTRAGFLLSIAAVLGLILLARAEEGKGHGTFGWVRELLLATAVAGAATAPVLVGTFGQFSMVGMVANLVAVPLMGIATYLGMIALLVWPLGWEQPFLLEMGEIVRWVNALAVWMSGWHFANVEIGREWWWVVGVSSMIVVGGVLLKRWLEAGIGLVGMVVWVGVVAVTAVKPDVMIWDDGKIGLMKAGEGYRVLWAEKPKDVEDLAKIARVRVEMGDDVPQTVDEAFMPVTSYEHFAWAERIGGRWTVEALACGRVWEKTGAECYE